MAFDVRMQEHFAVAFLHVDDRTAMEKSVNLDQTVVCLWVDVIEHCWAEPTQRHKSFLLFYQDLLRNAFQKEGDRSADLWEFCGLEHVASIFRSDDLLLFNQKPINDFLYFFHNAFIQLTPHLFLTNFLLKLTKVIWLLIPLFFDWLGHLTRFKLVNKH
jgi:hypothetical protein